MSSAAAPEPASLSAAARVAELFERHGRMTYGICRAMLRDVQEAEDAAQQAFLSAHRALLGGVRVRDEGAWIATIARNECRARITAAMRAPLSVPGEDLAEIPDVIDDAERRLQAGELRDALAELPERQREAVILRYVYGLRYGEVAKALSLSRPATEALLFRARRAMRVRLRHVAGVALVVPLSVREDLALALPGFEARAASGPAAAGVAGGVLAKLVSAPVAAKVATATVALSTVGAAGVVDPDRPALDARAQSRLVAVSQDDPTTESSSFAPEDRAGDGSSSRGHGGSESGSHDSDHDDRRDRNSGSSRGSDDSFREASGRGQSDSAGRDHDPGDESDEGEIEHTASSGPSPGDVEADDESRSDSSSGHSEQSDSSRSGSDGQEEPGDDSGSSGSGSSSGGGEADSRGSGSDDEPDAEDP